MVVITFLFSSFIPIFGSVSADYTTGERGNMTVALNISFSSYSTILTNGKYNGPTNTMVKAPNGDYLAFIREADTHMGIGDYGLLKMHRSTDGGATFSFDQTLMGVSNQDVRNPLSGVSATGRIFLFAWVYDCDHPANATDPSHGPFDYMYSDDSGSTWSSPAAFTTGTVDGFNGTNISSGYGKLEIFQNNRIGFSYFALTDNSTVFSQTRFAYSDNNGANWSCVNITAVMPYPTQIYTETDLAYIGNGQIIAVTRIDTAAYVHMFTSVDNGLTWSDRGQMAPMFSGICRGPTLTTIEDNAGGIWVLGLFVYNNYFYSIAYGPDLMADGANAWPTPEQYAPGGTETGWNVAGTCIMDQETGVGKFLSSQYVPAAGTAYVSMQNISITITLSRAQLNEILYGPQTGGLVNLIALMFTIGIVVGVVAEGTKLLRKQRLPTTQEMVKSVLNMVIYIVIGMALIGVVYTALG